MPDLGTKHECTNCSTRFYDLGKPDPICPKCGLNQNAEEVEEPAPEEEEEVEEPATKPPADDKPAAGEAKEEGDDKDPAAAPDG